MINRRFPKYPDDADYTTNSSSYYEDLARKNKLIKKLAERIWEYDEILATKLKDINERLDEYLKAWDKNLEEFPENVELLLQDWLSDGTLDHIINDTIFNWKLDADIFHDMFYTVKEFGAVGDGVTDDTDAIQLALDEVDILFFPSGVYYFTNINLTKSDTTILFDKNVTLKSDDSGDNLDAGGFNVTGNEDITIDVLETIEIGNTNFKVESLTPFQIGDLVKITQTQPDQHSRDHEIHKQFYSQSLVTIRAIDPINNIISVNEPMEHRFFADPKVTLVKPIENIKIIGDGTKFDKMGTREYSNHFNIQHAKNFHIEGFETFNGGGKGLNINRTFQYTVKNMIHHSPTNVSSGHGYGMITRASSYGLIENHYTYNSRHAVDISTMSYQTIVRNSYGFNSPFTTHGGNTQFLTFDNCHGFGSGISIGNYSFWSDNDVKILNCSVTNHRDSGVNIASGSYNITIDNLDVTNSLRAISVLGESEQVNISNAHFKNCNVGIELRGKNINVINSIFEEVTTTNISINSNASHISFNNIRVSNSESGRVMTLKECSEVHFNQLIVDGSYTRVIYLDVGTSDISFSNSSFKTSGTRMIEFVEGIGTIKLNFTNTSLEQDVITVYDSESIIQDISFKNSVIKGTMNLRGIDDLKLIGNEIDQQIELNTNSTKLFAVGNYGNGLLAGKPENDENILITNNLV